jgi:hypothetical protein
MVYINIGLQMCSFRVFKVCLLTFGSSYYVTVNVPYVHLLPENRPQPYVLLPAEDNAKVLACCVLSENVTIQFWRISTSSSGDEYTNNLNSPTSLNLVDLKQVSAEAGQLPHSTSLLTRKLLIQIAAAGA